MAAVEKTNSNPWVWATLICGLFGVVTTTPLLTTSNPSAPSTSSSGPRGSVDASDDLYPSPRDAISKRLGPWDDPFDPLKNKLKFGPPQADSASVVDIVRSQLKDRDDSPIGRLIVLIKVVDGKDTEEGAESRRRHRHAVELAMTSAGYSMPFPDRMTYLESDYNFYHTRDQFNRISIDIPIKLYRKRIGLDKQPVSTNQLALIAWVRDEHLGERPLNALSQIVQNILPQKSGLQEHAAIGILGPNTSDRLSKMVAEHRLPTDTREDVQPLSAFFDSWKYGAALFNSTCTASNAGIGFEECQHQIRLGGQSSLPVAHIIGEDSRLIDCLTEELKLRGRTGRTVLFVEEQSQKYIDELKESFKRSANDLVFVPYLRGISKVENGASSVSDYLNRTFSLLRTQQTETVSAVGVFGTQTSDKLAIFRAAREVFPTAAFFTTELDARYSDARNYNDCRNLLVTSHFGLSCQTELFGGTNRTMPTFRDGYQTSVFMGTLIALSRFETSDSLSQPTTYIRDGQDLYNLWDRPAGKAACGSSSSLHPLMFEISRLGNFQFPVQDNDSQVVTNAFDRQPLFAQYWFLPRLFAASMLLLLVGLVIRSYSSELNGLLGSTAFMLRAVGSFFKHSFGRSWQFFKRVTHPTSDGPDIPNTLFSSSTADAPASDQANPSTELGWFVAWFVMAVATSLVLFTIAWESDVSPDGEPVSLTDSISIWPSVLMFHVVSCVSSYLILRYIRHSRDLSIKGIVLAVLLVILIVCVMGTIARDAPPARGEVTAQPPVYPCERPRPGSSSLPPCLR